MIAKRHLVNNGMANTDIKILVIVVIFCAGRFNVPEEYVADAAIISNSTKVVYLIPTTTREGICSTMLLDFLVTTHNEFINYYHKHYPLAEKFSDE